ncbi:FAR-RED impaired response 1-like protein [Tanacetum coccineum]
MCQRLILNIITLLVRAKGDFIDVISGGYEDLPFMEKDCRKYINKVKWLKFRECDAEAIQDARSREAYEEFGDVVTFDTTYLTNRYEKPMAPFVGMNHHGQSILLGCRLISNEDTKTFTWLLRSWLTGMSGHAPDAIITDQDQAMKNEI